MKVIMWLFLGTVVMLVIGNLAAPDAKTLAKRQATPEQQSAARLMVLAEGYKCETVKSMMALALDRGWWVQCERYNYDLENHGGMWSVIAK